MLSLLRVDRRKNGSVTWEQDDHWQLLTAQSATRRMR
jgi:hypothetical protein